MFAYTLRRLAFAIPTLLFISLILFLLLDLAPGDPTASLPLTIPLEVREKIRLSLGLGEPVHIRYVFWLNQFFVNEPLHLISSLTGLDVSGERPRVISWQSRSPVVDIVLERMPQTFWVVGLSYVVGILIAVPVGIVSAWRQQRLVRPDRDVRLHGRILRADLLQRCPSDCHLFRFTWAGFPRSMTPRTG